MKAGLRAFRTLSEWMEGRSRQIGIVLFVLFLLGVSRVAESLLLSYQEKNAETVIEEQTEKYLSVASKEFVGLQRSCRRMAGDASINPLVLDYLSGRSTDRAPLFGVLSLLTMEQGIGMELYDREGDMVAWGGLSGPAQRSEVRVALEGQLTSRVTRTSSSSQLFLAVPVREGGKIIGAVLVRRTVELNYPLSNTYLTPEGLSDELAHSQGVVAEYNFSADPEVRMDARYFSAPLVGIDSARVGFVSILRPTRAAIQERTITAFQTVNAVLLLVLLGLVAAGLLLRAAGFRSLPLRILYVSAIIWLTRYGLLWLGLPTSLVSVSVFDPSSFASKFGGGLAKSGGEMMLSVIALGLNVSFVLLLLFREGGPALEWLRARRAAVRWSLALVVTFFIFWLLRGYAAVVLSAVFDSTLNYDDPRRFFPSLDLAVMVFNLMVTSFCMVGVSVGAVWFLLSLLDGVGKGGSASATVTVGMMFVAAAVLFTTLQENPLMSMVYAISFALVVVWTTALALGRFRRGMPVATRNDFLFAFTFSALLLYPPLEESIQEKSRRRVEMFAEEVLRPVDNWLKFVVEEALQSYLTASTAGILTGDDQADIDALAFTLWSRSSACREGYASAFEVADSTGREVSRFTIGSQAALASQVDTTTIVSRKTIKVKEIGNGINAVKVYAGAVPIADSTGRILGYGHVVVTAGQQTLFRGDNPLILRAASRENLESLDRQVTISEFRSGLLVTSNTNSLPIGYTLPDTIRRQFEDPARTKLWANEVIDGKRYETYYARRENAGNTIIALNVPDLGMVHQFVILVRVIVYYLIVLAVVLGVNLVVGRVRGSKKVMAFRDRLLIAFLVTAIVPLMLIIFYGRYTARQRLTENMSQRLEEETSTVVAYVKEQMGASGREEGFPVRTATAEAIAAYLGSDFNLFVGNELFVSTRPELYDIGVIDRRMSGSAFAAINIRGRRFHLETESIGRYQYAVGYRPVLDNAGVIVGVVSVPTLYRQDELEEEIFRRNAFLFGVYALVLLFIAIVATTFANRIAAPILRLTEATKRVSRGDLEGGLNVPTAESEIGELVRSFEKMTKDLRTSREELVRYERELAWKEMAKQVAHEIKNPLTPMKLAVQHLRQTYRDGIRDFDNVLENVTRTLLEQIDTLSHIASEFSHFARMPKRRIESCDINAVLSESVQLFGQHPGLEIDIELAAGVPPVSADREELRRAFINVIRNGMQAMNGAGKLVIRTMKEAGGGTVIIQDFGSGIAEEIKERLFEPNFSTKTDGMGLGLAIVKKTIDDLGGTIRIASESGKGTTVFMFLPVEEDRP